MTYTATSLGFLPGIAHFSRAKGSNSVGSVVVGFAADAVSQRPVYWDNANVIHQLPEAGADPSPYAQASACSSDGSVIVGVVGGATDPFLAVVWTGGPSWVATALPFPGTRSGANAFCCSSDGNIVGGYTINPTGGLFPRSIPCIWTGGVLTEMPLLPGTDEGLVYACSADGSILVGFVSDTFGSVGNIPVKWTGGPSWVITALGTLPGGIPGNDTSAHDCSSTGSIIVGAAADASAVDFAVYWNPSTANALSGPFGGASSAAFGCDGTGVYICGLDVSQLPTVWISGTGSNLPLFAGAMSVDFAEAMSDDASTIVGSGTNGSGEIVAVKWTASASSHVATMGDLFFANTSGFVDFTQVANRRKFIAVNGGGQDLQPDGSGPFAVAPQVYLSNRGASPNSFGNNNGRGGVFVRTGPSLTAGASDPPDVETSSTTAATNVAFSAVLGDYLTGNIYTFNPETLTDNGQPRKWLRRWRALPGETNSAVTFSYLAIDMETGIGVPPGTNPQVVLRWSDDGGHSWSAERIIPVGDTGKTAFVVKANRLGSTTRFSASTRIFELSSTDPFKVALISAEVLVK